MPADAVAEAPKQAAAPAPTAKPITPPQIPPKSEPKAAPASALSDADLETAGEEAFAGKAAPKAEAKPVATPEVKADDKAKAETKPAESKKEGEAKPAEAKPQEEHFPDMRAARGAIARRDAQISTIQSERDKALNELTSLKTKLEKGEIGGDAKLMAEQLAEKEQELAQVRGKLAELDYTQSPQFAEKFHKPYAQAKARGAKAVQRLTVTLQDGTTRPATEQDWEWLAKKPADQAHEIAKAAFGENYNVAAYHLNRLEEIRDQADAERDEHRATWQKKSKEEMAQTAKERELWGIAKKVAREDLVKQNPDFQPSDDEEENKALQSGLDFLDNLEQRMETLTPTERVATEVQAGLKLAAFDRMKIQRDKLKAQLSTITTEKDAKIAELEARIKEMTDSGPGPSRRQGEAGKHEKDWLEATPEEAGFQS